VGKGGGCSGGLRSPDRGPGNFDLIPPSGQRGKRGAYFSKAPLLERPGGKSICAGAVTPTTPAGGAACVDLLPRRDPHPWVDPRWGGHRRRPLGASLLQGGQAPGCPARVFRACGTFLTQLSYNPAGPRFLLRSPANPGRLRFLPHPLAGVGRAPGEKVGPSLGPVELPRDFNLRAGGKGGTNGTVAELLLKGPSFEKIRSSAQVIFSVCAACFRGPGASGSIRASRLNTPVQWQAGGNKRHLPGDRWAFLPSRGPSRGPMARLRAAPLGRAGRDFHRGDDFIPPAPGLLTYDRVDEAF